jgi:hypothetical protein
VWGSPVDRRLTRARRAVDRLTDALRKPSQRRRRDMIGTGNRTPFPAGPSGCALESATRCTFRPSCGISGWCRCNPRRASRPTALHVQSRAPVPIHRCAWLTAQSVSPSEHVRSCTSGTPPGATGDLQTPLPGIRWPRRDGRGCRTAAPLSP